MLYYIIMTGPYVDLEPFIPAVEREFDALLDISGDSYKHAELADRMSYDFPVFAAILAMRGSEVEVVARATNNVQQSQNSLDHGEMVAMRSAIHEASEDHHLPDGAVLATTVEPCAMCASGLVHARGAGLIFGASQLALRGTEMILPDGSRKPFRSEPREYTARNHIQQRDSRIDVRGGVRALKIPDYIARGAHLGLRRPKVADKKTD